MASNFLTKLFGSRNDRTIKQYRKIVNQINALEKPFEALTEEQLKAKTVEKKQKATPIRKCSCCKIGILHTLAIFDKRGPPAWYLGGSQKQVALKN